jgi:hypothetical protein
VEAAIEPEGPSYRDVLALRDELDADGYGTVDLVAFAHAVLARYGRPTIEPVPDTKAHELLNLLLDDLDALVDSSEGVAGLHLNGDVASWESLREGGRFETWLMRMDEARAFLDSTMDEPDDIATTIEPVPEPEGNGLFHWRNLGDGKPVQVRECPMCGIAPANVDDCGRFGDPACPYFGVGEPEPEGVTDEEWDAIKDRMWRHYETTGYQGERFIYQGDFDTALDVARQELARFARPTIKPVPVAERPWEREGWCDKCGMCWRFDPCDRGWWSYGPILPSDGDPAPFTYLLPHHALPVPGA